MPLRIPPTQKDALKLFMELPDDQADSLRRALETAEPAISVYQLAQTILPKVTLDIKQLRQVIAVVGSLYLSRDQQGLTPDQIAEASVSAAAKEGLLNPGDAEKTSKLKQRIAQFVQLDNSLGVSAKATMLLVKHKNPLASVRIITDVRPIFAAGASPKPRAAVLFHTLELITNTDGRRLSHYIALDSSDLKALKAAV